MWPAIVGPTDGAERGCTTGRSRSRWQLSLDEITCLPPNGLSRWINNTIRSARRRDPLWWCSSGSLERLIHTLLPFSRLRKRAEIALTRLSGPASAQR